MALKSTIFKAQINVADTDRQVYNDFALTLARHPSETDRRMLLRLMAFALNADEALTFGRGISTDDEPDIWLRDLTGHIELWIELGNPDPDRLRKACAKADRVILYAYGDRATPVWWQKHADSLVRFNHLHIWQINDDEAGALEQLLNQNMKLQVTIADGSLWVTNGEESCAVTPLPLKVDDNRG